MENTHETTLSFFRRAPALIKLKLLFLWMLGAIVAATSGWIIFTIVTFKDDGSHAMPALHEEAAASAEHGESVAEFTYSYLLSPVAIALVDRRKVRTGYAQFNMVFDCPNEKCVREMELNRARILNALNETAVQFNFEDFQSPAGFNRFKNAFRGALVELFHENAPRTIVLRDWLMN